MDYDVGAAGQSRALIPEGNYEAQVISVGRPKSSFGRSRRWFVCFKIIQPGNFHGTDLTCVYTQYPCFSPSSKIYRDWSVVKGRLPRRGEKISPAAFLHGIFLVRVRTVRFDQKNQALPPINHYSIVDRIVEVIQTSNPLPTLLPITEAPL